MVEFRKKAVSEKGEVLGNGLEGAFLWCAGGRRQPLNAFRVSALSAGRRAELRKADAFLSLVRAYTFGILDTARARVRVDSSKSS